MTANFWTEILFPSRCLTCQAETRGREVICENCFSKIKINQTLFCGLCRARLAANKKICHQDFPYLLGSACDYEEGAVKNLIASLKFQLIKAAAEPLAEWLIEYARAIDWPWQEWLVVPMPLSRQRLRERGFNQVELMGEIFARHFGARVEKESLERIKNTSPQSEAKSFEQRLSNLKGAFRVISPALVAGKKIALLDDVVTSGATLKEAALTLKAAGAKRILALTVARA